MFKFYFQQSKTHMEFKEINTYNKKLYSLALISELGFSEARSLCLLAISSDNCLYNLKCYSQFDFSVLGTDC